MSWESDCERSYQNDMAKREAGADAPTPALASCSEVVERLAAYIVDDLLERHPKSAWKHYIERALHEWREHRVQELETALWKYGRHLVTCHHLSENMRSNSDCNCGWESIEHLANSEWREQIRKGANHD